MAKVLSKEELKALRLSIKEAKAVAKPLVAAAKAATREAAKAQSAVEKLEAKLAAQASE